MSELHLGAAVDLALDRAMGEDPDILLIGEDVPMLRGPLLAHYGADRVLGAPISESAFIGAAVAAAMDGLRPVVELYMVDFLAVAFDALLNHAAKVHTFSGGSWSCPMVLRAPSGGGYGDGGQHAQSLWGTLAAIPGLTVVVPSTPQDAYGLMRTALTHDGPVVFLEPKLLSEDWLEYLGLLGRDRELVGVDVPSGARGPVDEAVRVPFGKARVCRVGTDVTVVSVAVGVHRALEAAADLEPSCEVIDLRCLRPLDVDAVVASVRRTGRLVVVDEDYRELGLSGELAAVCLEVGLAPRFARVCVEDTLPYNYERERAALPNVERIAEAVRTVCDGLDPR